MASRILDGKCILAVDDEPDVLKVLEEEIMAACPSCRFDTATSYNAAVTMMHSNDYDVVILDIMGVRGFDLLDFAVKRHFRVAMLTAHSLNVESLKRSIDMKARAYLPKEKLGQIVPFLEDILKYDYASGWKRLFEKLHSFFAEIFEPDWEEKIGINWREWGQPSAL